MANPTDKPLIVQSDHTLLLEVVHALADEARESILPFADLLKSPEHVHTYRISPLSLWNASASGLGADEVLERLEAYSRYALPANLIVEIRTQMDRYGLVELLPGPKGEIHLHVRDEQAASEVFLEPTIRPFLLDEGNGDARTRRVAAGNRGEVKIALTSIGFPARDLVGFVEGDKMEMSLRETMTGGAPFQLRNYQKAAVEAFYQNGSPEGGQGIVVLPCGAGKTIIGIAAMARLGVRTLILVTNTVAAKQWIREILDKTGLTKDDVGEYDGSSKEVRAVTVATYQILIYRRKKDAAFPHMDLFRRENWGLIIYDEVHVLPAPIFRATSEIQSRRRLGLTATLVREDGRETDVFSLIGPKRYELPWRDLESKGWIAEAHCYEVRVPLPNDVRAHYASADKRRKYRVAAENPLKEEVVQRILARHVGDHVLVIGGYLSQLRSLAWATGAPLITGQTPAAEREILYDRFRRGDIRILVVSKVANFAVDLPEANVAIQVSGAFGSRQEEAQRLGRILRPKAADTRFYSLVTSHTSEQEFALKRQLFLTEQGYHYNVIDLESPEAIEGHLEAGKPADPGWVSTT
ncbi:MAG: DEAD/DEAH box helicase [Gemmatimonadota bacterium]|nr:MAG: DEAD/DEAH box helicase [Gemmatimonadota bacterium]